MNRVGTFITIAALLLVIVAINFFASRHPFRIDLTDNKVYTLSDATKKILEELEDVITVRLYFTESIPPSLKPLRRNVDDILSEFKSAAGNKFQIEFIDPNSSSVEEQKAVLLGIPPIQLNVIERDKQEVAKIFLGMAILYGDKQQIIPVIKQIHNLEYDLTEAILKVSSDKLPMIGWLASKDSPETYLFMRDSLSRRYKLTDINNETISDLDPKKYGALVIISPHELSEESLFSIDQFIMGGGKIVLLADRFQIEPSMKVTEVDSNLFALLKHYGAVVKKSLLLDQSNAMAAFSGGPVTYHLPYAFWPDIRMNQFNPNNPLVSDIESIVLPWTSPLALSATEDDVYEEEVLASSSQYSTTVPADKIELDPQSANEASMRGERGPKPLIALLSGPFGSYYEASDRENVIKESPELSKIFVVGSSRWISDKFLNNFPTNTTLFENAVDSFAMGNTLIGIRSRNEISRPIAIMPDGVKQIFKYLNLAIGPILTILIGLVVFIITRKRRRKAVHLYE
ncbi:MAG: GldG family protein [Deltaproteobacteria bacterium]|jgi:ABC-2 type transport system permease protein|nr:GldG family protein [Deltaproteobacteria bacterium]